MLPELNVQKTQNHSEPIDLKNGEMDSQLSWWLEVITSKPQCVYYFGPFESSEEAEISQKEYIEELKQEGAEGIDAKIKFDNPKNLTICQDDSEITPEVGVNN